MVKSDAYGEYIDFRLDVYLGRQCCNGYHYVLMGVYKPKDPSKECFWSNTGISGVEETAEKAFSVGHARFLKIGE